MVTNRPNNESTVDDCDPVIHEDLIKGWVTVVDSNDALAHHIFSS